MSGLADRIDSPVNWGNLVLPAEQAGQLHDLAQHAAARAVVGDAWGFTRRGGRGHGIAALFSGPPGTGKTLAARIVARVLGHDLYRVDLSRVVSKYVGETEKNLARVFDAADAGGAVLLFDEADALFGKRSEVKDSHDRYANLEIAYLLQRVEAFNGLAILTSNLDRALDAAFLRRLAFVVRFPFPGEAARHDIWTRAFPAEAPCAPLPFARLARLPIAGGHIAAIAWSAACRAALASGTIELEHVIAAARAECVKLDKPWQESWLREDVR
ncbi:ATP-binding protein [Paraburkholderia sp. JHI869]|uniref:ATP-binding protein n=1 Tax=Paraburkholderia sp. JHI869 TaxID=3112959 RepID=UPI003172A990